MPRPRRDKNFAIAHYHPWNRQPGETDKSWNAFRIFRALNPATRTLKELSAIQDTPIYTLKKWSSIHNWMQRVRQYDQHIDAQVDRDIEKLKITRQREIVEKSHRAASLKLENAILLDEKLNERIQSPRGKKEIDDMTLEKLDELCGRHDISVEKMIRAGRMNADLSEQNRSSIGQMEIKSESHIQEYRKTMDEIHKKLAAGLDPDDDEEWYGE